MSGDGACGGRQSRFCTAEERRGAKPAVVQWLAEMSLPQKYVSFVLKYAVPVQKNAGNTHTWSIANVVLRLVVSVRMNVGKWWQRK